MNISKLMHFSTHVTSLSTTTISITCPVLCASGQAWVRALSGQQADSPAEGHLGWELLHSDGG